MAWEPRDYRTRVEAEGLVSFEIVVAETDLQILAQDDLSEEAERLVKEVRADIECYIDRHPRFAESFVPFEVEPAAPAVVRQMSAAASAAGVGPMAAVAGAVAEYVARGLEPLSGEVIVENGGDVYLCGRRERIVGLWAGERGAPGVGLEIAADRLPIAVATSSGTIGHSVSFGAADAVAVLSVSGALADAVATATANTVRDAADLDRALEAARRVPGVVGVVASIGGAVAAWGAVTLAPTRPLD